MKTLNVMLFWVFVMLSSCQGQNKNHTDPTLSLQIPQGKHSNADAKPDIRFKVNKTYDEKGNVVSYDSTYSYSYAGSGVTEMPDLFSDNAPTSGLFRGFPDFHGQFSGKKDSTMMSPFNMDYFQKQVELNQQWMDDFFKRFQSMQKRDEPDIKTDHTTQKTI